MRKAVIDLGTNTFNLLIGEVSNNSLRTIHVEKEAVLLGMKGINEGKIADDAIERAMIALKQFKLRCEEFQVERIRGIGTSALRDAENRMELIDRAKKELNIPIDVISGIEESQLIYNGVCLSHQFNEPAMIMDIGGGSTEFILANEEQVIAAQSFNIGVSRIFQELGCPETYTRRHYDRMKSFFEEETGSFFQENPCDVLIGASGSFETMFEMIYQRKFIRRDDTFELPIEEVKKQIDWVLNSNYEDRMANKYIIPMRKKMIPIAAFKIRWVINQLSIKKVLLTPYSLKEGAFKD